MTGKTLLAMLGDLEEYLTAFDDDMKRKENREHLRRYAKGQLGTIERKSLEPMADADGINPRRLQYFLTRHGWDASGVRDRLQRKVTLEHGGADGIFVIDETSDAKKGAHTAGVARQYCGESGKIDNCIVTVHLAYVRGEFHALLDGALFLPEAWDWNPKDPQVMKRRAAAGIPETVRHETKAAMALRQLHRALSNGVPGRYVTADEWYGSKPWWRREVDAMGLIYVVEVPRAVQGRTSPPSSAAPAAQTVQALAATGRMFRKQAWTRFCVHDTEKGPDIWEVKRSLFWEQAEQAPPRVQILLVCRNVRTQEIKYFLSNADADAPTMGLVRIAFSRWQVERCFQDCKSELGLNHAEMRLYQGIQRHLILTAVNYYFMVDWLSKHNGGINKDLSISQCADAVQKLLEQKQEGILMRSQLGLLAKRLAADIRRTQHRNRKARVSATKRRVQIFKRMGIHCFKLISCDSVKLAL